MVAISIHNVQQQIRDHLERVKAGEVIYITEGDEVIAEIRPPISRPSGKRPIGLAEGEVVAPDDFDAPLPHDVLKSFEGE